MSFMIGQAPIRRTLNYLEKCAIYFRENVNVFTVNYNTAGNHHSGARDFVFWNLPQIQYKNPNVQCLCFKNLTPSPFIRIFFDNGKSTLIDIDSREKEEIVKHLENFTAVCQTKDEIKINMKKTEKLSNPSYFGFDCQRHCMCEVLGQVPCPNIIKMPKSWRGIKSKKSPYEVPPSFMEVGLKKKDAKN